MALLECQVKLSKEIAEDLWTVRVDTLSSGYVKFSFFVIKAEVVALLTWRRHLRYQRLLEMRRRG
ncbi:16506_t:CDS:2 [Funneliformis geosporum]|uniref:16506_t:CDS:1 n=1 Tax=Funneliformis geosporum TaxID=1117311 RepID=A0A9W4SMN0_9GLOM|nr:16506_t:CDS:2 [Funneliformis geosporum]